MTSWIMGMSITFSDLIAYRHPIWMACFRTGMAESSIAFQMPLALKGSFSYAYTFIYFLSTSVYQVAFLFVFSFLLFVSLLCLRIPV